MKKILIFGFLSLSSLLFSCGGGSPKGTDKVTGSSGTSCYDEYSEMYDWGNTIANSYGGFGNMVLDWHFNEKTINETIAIMEEMRDACTSALAFTPSCDKLKESKALLDNMANVAKPKAEEALKAMNEMREDDQHYGIIRKVYDDLGRNLKFIDFFNTINESGANVVR